jgi:predicted amidohydrolase YtcJ
MYDKLIKNARIYSLDKEENIYSWIAIKNGRIEAIGKDDASEIKAVETIDVDGKTLVPGFINAHMHSLATGINASSIDLGHAHSIEEVLESIRLACQKNKDASLLYFEGLNIHQLKEGQAPSQSDVDNASEDVPVFIRYMTGHGLILNTLAKARAGIDDLMTEEQMFSLVQGLNTDRDIQKHIEACASQCVACGTTTINSIIGGELPDDRDCPIWIDEELKQRTLPVKVINFYQSKDPQTIHDLGLKRIGGCVCLDGTPVERNAAFFEPYEDVEGHCGELYMKDEELHEIVSKAHALNMQCTFHAVGDKAVDQLLHTYQRVVSEQGNKGLRHRVEHCDLPSETHLALAKDLGVVQPICGLKI